jgi:hypothetical protein
MNWKIPEEEIAKRRDLRLVLGLEVRIRVRVKVDDP